MLKLSVGNPGTWVADGMGEFIGYIPVVVAGAITVALAIWGVKRLASLFKSLAR